MHWTLEKHCNVSKILVEISGREAGEISLGVVRFSHSS